MRKTSSKQRKIKIKYGIMPVMIYFAFAVTKLQKSRKLTENGGIANKNRLTTSKLG